MTAYTRSPASGAWVEEKSPVLSSADPNIFLEVNKTCAGELATFDVTLTNRASTATTSTCRPTTSWC